MRLDRLHIQNFRCYEDATFDFQPGFNLVVGVNGSGKTSLLQAVAASFVEFASAMQSGQSFAINDDVRFIVDKFRGRTRYEKKFPITLAAKGDVLGAVDWTTISLVEDWAAGTNQNLKNAVDQFLTQSLPEAKIYPDLPILAFYRADRRWKNANVSAEFAAQQKISRFSSYNNWFDAVADLKDFESWLIAKTLERMQTLLDEGLTSSEFDDELAWVNQAIKFALPEANDLRYDLRMQSLLIDMGDGQTLPFGQLSDGQRGMVALFADIARRMCILNPHMGKDVLKNTSGVVIIDELDIHLHPAFTTQHCSGVERSLPQSPVHRRQPLPSNHRQSETRRSDRPKQWRRLPPTGHLWLGFQ